MSDETGGGAAASTTADYEDLGDSPARASRGRASWGRASWGRASRGRSEAVASLRKDPRTAVLVISGFLTVVLFALVSLLPAPYAVLRPGPVVNTLGSEGGKPLIEISGHRTYPTKGRLDLTTVTIFGGPGNRVSLVQVLEGWLDGSVAVVPQEVVFPPGTTQRENDRLNREEMVSSQESATAAALSTLGISVPTTLTIVDVDPKAPAESVLRPKDVLLAVDGTPVSDLAVLRTVTQSIKAGDEATITVRRGRAEQDLRVRTHAEAGRTLLGIYIDPRFHFPFTVKIRIDNIGGPSAGMMFALGIIDLLTPGELSGGQHIAGTGAIDPDGTVMSIGGIREKLVGARDAGAQWFLAPASNCGEVVGNVPAGLRVVKVVTLTQARDVVERIAAGKGLASLPACTR